MPYNPGESPPPKVGEYAERLAVLIFEAVELVVLPGSVSAVAVDAHFTNYIELHGPRILILGVVEIPVHFDPASIKELLLDQMLNHSELNALLNRIEREWPTIQELVASKSRAEVGPESLF